MNWQLLLLGVLLRQGRLSADQQLKSPYEFSRIDECLTLIFVPASINYKKDLETHKDYPVLYLCRTTDSDWLSNFSKNKKQSTKQFDTIMKAHKERCRKPCNACLCSCSL